MARYDEDSGFISPLPGVPDFNAHDSGQPGPGSTGIQAHQHSGSVVGEASGSSVFGPGAGSRMPELDTQVGSGDSNSFSDGLGAHSSAIDGNAGADGEYLNSGAGQGTIATKNPSSEFGPGPMARRP